MHAVNSFDLLLDTGIYNDIDLYRPTLARYFSLKLQDLDVCVFNNGF